jgi:hypothetical protein
MKPYTLILFILCSVNVMGQDTIKIPEMRNNNLLKSFYDELMTSSLINRNVWDFGEQTELQQRRYNDDGTITVRWNRDIKFNNAIDSIRKVFREYDIFLHDEADKFYDLYHKGYYIRRPFNGFETYLEYKLYHQESPPKPNYDSIADEAAKKSDTKIYAHSGRLYGERKEIKYDTVKAIIMVYQDGPVALQVKGWCVQFDVGRVCFLYENKHTRIPSDLIWTVNGSPIYKIKSW